MKTSKSNRLLLTGIFWFLLCMSPLTAQHNAEWMQELRFGVMHHFLADWISSAENIEMDVDTWNKLIDEFDVEGLADQLHLVGAGYCIFTIGQNSGYYLAPNSTYDSWWALSHQNVQTGT